MTDENMEHFSFISSEILLFPPEFHWCIPSPVSQEQVNCSLFTNFLSLLILDFLSLKGDFDVVVVVYPQVVIPRPSSPLSQYKLQLFRQDK